MDPSAWNPSERRIMDGTAWAEFCDTLKAAGAVVLGEGTPENPFDRAEGFRYLTRLLRAALETFVEDADPLAPELLRTAHETVKMGDDNPDNYYQNAPISGRHEYRISGHARHRALPGLRHAGGQLRRDRQPEHDRLPRRQWTCCSARTAPSRSPSPASRSPATGCR